MQEPAPQSRHPLQSEEVGFDPLQSDLGKHDIGISVDEKRSQPVSNSEHIFISYSKEWEELFVNSNYLAAIRLKGINGQLRSSRFRSVCWKLFLNVLPQDRSQWISKTAELRMWYKKIKEIHITNPRKAAGQQDLMINNPLSQDEGSLWNKFFQDKELRAMIEQDVKRTFPEMKFFQQEDVRRLLTDVLFCYARENEHLLYKQGMHELLAPMLFILHCDHQAFMHASEAAEPSEEMKVVLNPDFLEHDAYALFSNLMGSAEPWFSTYEHDSRKEKDAMLSTMPFARPQDIGPSIAIVTKVNHIQDQLLKKHDIELYMHLNRLEIAPQIYGLRWLRLLFGREFPLQDLLVVWDALFADSNTLALVDYIFVAMLLYIRDALISSNYQTCLGLLMHYPPIGDVHSLILKALFLRDPKKNPRPMSYQFQQNLDYYRARGIDFVNRSRANTKPTPLNINKVSSSLLNFGRKLIMPSIPTGGPMNPMTSPSNTNITHSAGSTSFSGVMPTHTVMEPSPYHGTTPQQMQQNQRMMKSESMPVQLNKENYTQGPIFGQSHLFAREPFVLQKTKPGSFSPFRGQSSKNVSSSPSIESLPGGRDHTDSPPLSAGKKDSFFSNISRSRSHSKSQGKRESEEDLEAQISFLQGQLNDFDAMCKYCAKIMNTHLGHIQDVILEEKLEREDKIQVSLAMLKQVKDILKGSLRFNQSLLEAEENEEISITDDHYCSSLQMKEGEMQELEPHKPLQSHQDEDDLSVNTESRHSDDYILIPKEDDRSDFDPDLESKGTLSKPKGTEEKEPSSHALTFSDPLMGGTTPSSILSSSPDDDSSNNSKDSDFTIVSPLDI
ncbi:TBC1 domain family member 5 isoform X1 [Hyla sarda]|nr:TBC1 domain family member 5 isoform X1 [Hyla sarda]XP_056375908.1 TBC1 domain family member 5 isoform X1 [Hyla sarda]XP_056375909.1 TBC1 domain family member 5 isoform X1 [Hyla sarda]XP_056375910.1 TBC1 domain family member 5 isoform X1 [Hyla sarda]XP_056375911.1 TBC1 domain family member 5 isoform X1 [Hyla sarda]XP_056375912.1 TBC1 domain family member 5 isoform X1 [Hyla sarda]XP_056375913.1 TBC1 domain family member 5 isoform X1 [Hyla sarda]